jgi:alpha-D-ribose 1-methylphosphonate 5-phosphate C-P lyase
VMYPSPSPKFDNPKLANSPALQLFGAGREQRIYALPPHTDVVSLDFDDHPFVASKPDHDCDLCAASASYLDEVITDDQGGRMFVCSDTDFCRGRREKGHVGRLGLPLGRVA